MLVVIYMSYLSAIPFNISSGRVKRKNTEKKNQQENDGIIGNNFLPMGKSGIFNRGLIKLELIEFRFSIGVSKLVVNFALNLLMNVFKLTPLSLNSMFLVNFTWLFRFRAFRAFSV